MLRPDEQHYLDNLPIAEAERIIHINPYDPAIKQVAKNIIDRLHSIAPEAVIAFMGASALEISGQNDIDLYILTTPEKQKEYFPKIEALLGKQEKHKWHWVEEGFEISVYLADPESPSQKRQIDMFTLLKNNPNLLQEYKLLKESLDGKTYKEYQIAKYEFYNRVLPS